jgi:hypothetical protein
VADITDPQVIKFVNEAIRPISELLEKLDITAGSIIDRYWAQISELITANQNEDLIDDGREAEGISRLTKADLINTLSLLELIINAFDATGRRDVIRKPTVRLPRVN